MTDAQIFLDSLFSRAIKNHQISILWLPSAANEFFSNTRDAVGAAVSRPLSSTENVYVGVCPRKLGASGRGKAGDIPLVQVAWVEIDIAGPGHAAQNLPPTVEDAQKLYAHLPPPSIVVHSGGGIHVYWLLETPLDPKTGAEFVRRLQADVRAEAEVSGKKASGVAWKVDNTSDLARVLRVPGTYNRKTSPARPVELVSFIDHLAQPPGQQGYSPSDFNFATAAGASETDSTERHAVDRSAPDVPSGAAKSIGDPGPDSKRARPIASVLKMFSRLKRQDLQPIAMQIIRGESFAQPGERDIKLTRMTGALATIAPDNDPDELARVFAASLTEMATEAAECPTVADAKSKILRVQRIQRTNRAVTDAIGDALTGKKIETKFVVDDQEDPDDEPTDPDGKPIGESMPVDGQNAGQGASPSGYTPDQIDGFKAFHQTDDISRRWIIYTDGLYYFFADGNYRPPRRRETAPVAARTYLTKAYSAGVQLDRVTDKGFVQKTFEKVLEDYGSITDTVVVDLTAQKSYFDPKTRIFYEATCPLAPLEASYDPDVDAWLHSLGGADADKLLDWIATVTQLDRMSCAIYFSGKKSAGKSLLATGLAGLWLRAKGPTSLVNVLGNFNDSIAKCPLIFADEEIQQQTFNNKQSASKDLRRLIGNMNFQLNRKNLPLVDCYGAVRLILAANNEKMLELDREDLSKDDLEAVASRFLHIRCAKDTADMLADFAKNGDRPKRWLANKTIAKHALWLKENRQVKIEGQRFLVEGHATEMHKNLSTHSKVGSLVLEWLVRYLDQVVPTAAQTGLIRIGDGKLLVCSELFSQPGLWEHYIQSDRVPETRRIGSALKNWSDNPNARIGTHRAHDIPVQIVLDWSEQNMIGDPDKIKTRVAAPYVEPSVIPLRSIK